MLLPWLWVTESVLKSRSVGGDRGNQLVQTLGNYLAKPSSNPGPHCQTRYILQALSNLKDSFQLWTMKLYSLGLLMGWVKTLQDLILNMLTPVPLPHSICIKFCNMRGLSTNYPFVENQLYLLHFTFFSSLKPWPQQQPTPTFSLSLIYVFYPQNHAKANPGVSSNRQLPFLSVTYFL